MLDRSYRSQSKGYATKSIDQIFEQNTKAVIHDMMDPKNVSIRESCDSAEHPNTIPIQLYLDVTGSMGHIPHEMIKDGLPTLMSSLIENGVKDAALFFGAIGDHYKDRHPLQISQFESGDDKLDEWLTKTYIEGNGGGNGGESYHLAWYFGAYHTKIDSFDKRGIKGFIFTVGDEPCHKTLEASFIKDLMGSAAVAEGDYNISSLLKAAQEKNHVFHIHINHGRSCDSQWKELLGENLIELDDYKKLSRTISDIILSKTKEIIVKSEVTKEKEPPAETIKKEETFL